jgi:putative hydrolase of the HAD superfamily
MGVAAVFLDAGGVLVNPNWERVSETLARHGVDASAARLRAAEPLAKREMDQPSPIPVSDQNRGWVYFNLVLRRAGIEPCAATQRAIDDLRAFHDVHNIWEEVPADAPAALARLRSAGLRLAVVSNANGTVKALFERLDLARFFDVILDSQEEGVEKPDPRLFEIGLTRSGAQRESTVHVGDLYHVDVVGARAAGLAVILFDRADLYTDADCERVRSLTALADRLGC